MSFNPHITTQEIIALAATHGLSIQHECGGYRIVENVRGARHDVFPNSGVCPTTSRLACYIFLLGVAHNNKL